MLWLAAMLWSALAGGGSVSAVPPEYALWTNPAAIGLFQGWVLTAREQTGEVAVAFGPLAYGVSTDRVLQVGVGMSVKGPFRLGLAARTGPSAGIQVATLFRQRYGSFGARVWGFRDRTFAAAGGLALRPGVDGLTLYADANARFARSGDPEVRFQVGAFVQPAQGVHLEASWSATPDLEDPVFRAGLDLSFSRIRVGVGQSTRRETQVTAAVSRRPYPSWIPQRRYLKWALTGPISEDPATGLWTRRPSFTELLLALRQAARDPGVRGVLLQLENPEALAWNQLEEIRQALDTLRAYGKPVAAYLEVLTLKGLYLASGADQVLMPPTGMVLLTGLGVEKIYLKHTLEKLDIEVQAPHIGRYKSAVEPLIRDRMSEADREQTRALLVDIQRVVREDLLKRGRVPAERLDSLLYHGFLGDAEQAETLGLVDTLVPRHRLEKTLRHRWKTRREKSLVAYASGNLQMQTFRWVPEPPQVAVVTLEGSIVTGRSGTSPWPVIGGKYIGSSSVARLLRNLASNRRVRAVVLRVNSPGGSALASDIIWQAVRDLRAKKPVVVSMGRLAASGGYYISCGADLIFADRSTITGSIGILAAKFALGNLFRRWGLTRDTVLLSPHADAWSLWRPLSDEELAALDRYLHRGYQAFLRRVSEGRGIPVARVDSLGRGRVWSGLRADSLGLVDSLGGVVEAIRAAAQRAGLKPGEYQVAVYTTQPRNLGFLGLFNTEMWHQGIGLWLHEPYLYHMGFVPLPE